MQVLVADSHFPHLLTASRSQDDEPAKYLPQHIHTSRSGWCEDPKMVAHILGLRLQGSAVVLPATHRRKATSILSRLQSASAAALAAFGVVHLSAPLVGLLHLGGDINDRVDAVSRWMLLGRVAYQSSVGEILLWTALATHLVSSVAKRLITRFTVASSPVEDTKPVAASTRIAEDAPSIMPSKSATKLTTAQISGYVLTPYAIHHAFVNRVLPSSSTPPISGLSPSELDYSFVSYSLSHPNLSVRMLTAGAYTVLIVAYAVHTIYAMPALLRSLPRSVKPASRGKRKRRSQVQVVTSLAVVLLTSLFALVPLRSNDRLTVSGALKGRYDAVLRRAFPTRFFFR